MNADNIKSVCAQALEAAEKEFAWATANEYTYSAMAMWMRDWCKNNGSVSVRVEWQAVKSPHTLELERLTRMSIPPDEVLFTFTPHTVIGTIKISGKVDV